MIRAVLFDVDDTLIDYGLAERRGISSYLTALGITGDPAPAAARWNALQERHFGRYLAGQLDYRGQGHARAADMIAWLGLPPVADPYEWFLGYRACYEAALTLFPDVPPCLASLGAVPLGVISNNDEAMTRRKLDLVDLADRFGCVVGADTAGTTKPDPLIFHTACARLGIPPAEAAYVGDRRDTDAEAATAAGLTGIWINRTTAPGGLSDLRHLAGVLGLTPTDLGSPAPVG